MEVIMFDIVFGWDELSISGEIQYRLAGKLEVRKQLNSFSNLKHGHSVTLFLLLSYLLILALGKRS